MEKINNTEELKNIFEEKQNEYDKLVTRIDRLKDTIYELTTKYNVDKETKKRTLCFTFWGLCDIMYMSRMNLERNIFDWLVNLNSFSTNEM